MTYRIDIYVDGVKVAGVESSSPSWALIEASHYAMQYDGEGVIAIKIKNPKKEKIEWPIMK